MVSSFESHLLAANRCGTVPLNRRGENVLQRQIGRFAQFAGARLVEIRSGGTRFATCVALVVAVTKVTVLSAFFSLKEGQDYRKEKETALASLSSLFSSRNTWKWTTARTVAPFTCSSRRVSLGIKLLPIALTFKLRRRSWPWPICLSAQNTECPAAAGPSSPA
jgi:hypothetical protein